MNSIFTSKPTLISFYMVYMCKRYVYIILYSLISGVKEATWFVHLSQKPWYVVIHRTILNSRFYNFLVRIFYQQIVILFNLQNIKVSKVHSNNLDLKWMHYNDRMENVIKRYKLMYNIFILKSRHIIS